MGSVVSLASRREENSPHLSGEAKCAKCGREWVAVCPVGTVWLECSDCGSECGVMRGPVTGGEDSLIWLCACGCQLFEYTPDGARCISCGVRQVFP